MQVYFQPSSDLVSLVFRRYQQTLETGKPSRTTVTEHVHIYVHIYLHDRILQNRNLVTTGLR